MSQRNYSLSTMQGAYAQNPARPQPVDQEAEQAYYSSMDNSFGEDIIHAVDQIVSDYRPNSQHQPSTSAPNTQPTNQHQDQPTFNVGGVECTIATVKTGRNAGQQYYKAVNAVGGKGFTAWVDDAKQAETQSKYNQKVVESGVGSSTNPVPVDAPSQYPQPFVPASSLPVRIKHSNPAVRPKSNQQPNGGAVKVERSSQPTTGRAQQLPPIQFATNGSLPANGPNGGGYGVVLNALKDIEKVLGNLDAKIFRLDNSIGYLQKALDSALTDQEACYTMTKKTWQLVQDSTDDFERLANFTKETRPALARIEALATECHEMLAQDEEEEAEDARDDILDLIDEEAQEDNSGESDDDDEIILKRHKRRYAPGSKGMPRDRKSVV